MVLFQFHFYPHVITAPITTPPKLSLKPAAIRAVFDKTGRESDKGTVTLSRTMCNFKHSIIQTSQVSKNSELHNI